MPYPKSPFEDDFDTGVLWRLGDDEHADVSDDNEIQTEILAWLCQAPKISSFRVNTLKPDAGEVHKYLEEHLEGTGATVEKYPHFDDTIIVHHPAADGEKKLKIHDKEVIVDTICAAAVLRGAHIYAPGVLGMTAGTQVEDAVSVYADLAGKCKKGFAKRYEERKVFIGNGVAARSRLQLFGSHERVKVGIAVRMEENVANCPPRLGDFFIPPGVALLQNLPSIICVHVLAPSPEDTVLDMCASPGNKTTHIAALKNNEGRVVAIDKTPSKVAALRKNCDLFGTKVEIIQADSTGLIEEKRFPENSFDRILLDAPCSALGKRPQLLTTATKQHLRSYVCLQRLLFKNAVQLLKNGGVLVYSTCTITLGENEGIVSWALKNFGLELVEAGPIIGGGGMKGTSLSDDQLKKLQRFSVGQEVDTVGFFIAKFIKKY